MPIIESIDYAREHVDPPTQEELLVEQIERCGHCMLLWPSWQMTEELREDAPLRVCPNGRSPSTTIEAVTRAKERVADMAERFVIVPSLSLVPVEKAIPPTVNTIEDADGSPVYRGCPLRVERGGTSTLVLRGRSFPLESAAATALVTWPAGVVTSASATSDGLTMTITFEIDPDAPVGLTSVAVDGHELRHILLVR